MSEGHLLIAEHTRKYLREEHYFPGPTIDRANLARWKEEGSLTLRERAHGEVERHVNEYEPSRLPDYNKRELTKIMEAEARRRGMDRVPAREE